MLLDKLKMEFVGCFFITYIFALVASNYETESIFISAVAFS